MMRTAQRQRPLGRSLRSRLRSGPADRARLELAPRDYLTDGVNLFSFLGWGLAGDFAQLEDCRSLELVIVPTRDLREGCVRPVTPAAHL